MAKRYQVVAPYVTARTHTHEGPRVLGFQANAILPADVPADHIGHLLRKGLIKELAEPKPQPPAKTGDEDGDDTPAGTKETPKGPARGKSG